MNHYLEICAIIRTIGNTSCFGSSYLKPFIELKKVMNFEELSTMSSVEYQYEISKLSQDFH